MRTSSLALAWLIFGGLGLSAPGCTFGEEGGKKDAGQDAQDAQDAEDGAHDGDGGGEEIREYPPGPYGTQYDQTSENLAMELLDCDASPPTSRPWRLAEFLDGKATMLTVHAGWCTYCKQQAATMEADLQTPYGPRGLRLAIVMFEDASNPPRADRQSLIEYTCSYRARYGLSFPLLIDPSDNPNQVAPTMGQFFRPTQAGTPLNMLLNRNMVIKYKVEGLIPDSRILEGVIEGLLSE
jgi:thiol-disulfide isomerase/thioredoxin